MRVCDQLATFFRVVSRSKTGSSYLNKLGSGWSATRSATGQRNGIRPERSAHNFPVSDRVRNIRRGSRGTRCNRIDIAAAGAGRRRRRPGSLTSVEATQGAAGNKLDAHDDSSSNVIWRDADASSSLTTASTSTEASLLHTLRPVAAVTGRKSRRWMEGRGPVPQNLEWGTIMQSVPPDFQKYCSEFTETRHSPFQAKISF